jgi:hypothetical protein
LHANYITPQAVHVLTGRWGVLLRIVYRLTPGTPTKTIELYAFVIIVVGTLAAAAIRAADSHGTPQSIPRRAAVPLIVTADSSSVTALPRATAANTAPPGTSDRHEHYSVIVREIEIER